MLAVFIVDLGLALGLVGLVAIVRPIRRLYLPTRRRALGVAVAGALLVLAGFLAPAPEQSVSEPASHLDEIVPTWQFAEHHETLIHASPAAVEAAIRSVTAEEIALFRTLTWIRNPRLPWSNQPESILAPSARRPILEVALDSGFALLAEEPDREVVIGTLLVVPPASRDLVTEESRRPGFHGDFFHKLSEPGWVKAAMNFRWQEEGHGFTRLTTETRVCATDAGSRRRFAPYWRVIYPGSSLLRRTWLAAIRARAERSPLAPG